MSCFRPAARKLLEEVGDAEKALAMALARVTGFSAVKVGSQRNILRAAPPGSSFAREMCRL